MLAFLQQAGNYTSPIKSYVDFLNKVDTLASDALYGAKWEKIFPDIKLWQFKNSCVLLFIKVYILAHGALYSVKQGHLAQNLKNRYHKDISFPNTPFFHE